MEDLKLDYERECHWRMVLKDNDGWTIKNTFYMLRGGIYT